MLFTKLFRGLRQTAKSVYSYLHFLIVTKDQTTAPGTTSFFFSLFLSLGHTACQPCSFPDNFVQCAANLCPFNICGEYLKCYQCPCGCRAICTERRDD